MDTNTIIISGNLTRDPESVITKNGKTIVKFSVANNRGFGEYKTVNFFNCTCFGKLGEMVAKYCSKGKKVNVTGELRQNQYTNKDGVKVNTFEVIANEVMFIGGKADVQNDNQAQPEQLETDQTINSEVPF